MPVAASTVEPEKLSLPADWIRRAVGELEPDLVDLDRARRRRANSASDSAKRTQIGSARVSVVSSAESSFGETRLPIDCMARPVMPSIGASTAV